MRKAKDRAILAKAAGDDLTRKVEQLRLNQLKQKYGEITTLFKTPVALDRASVSGFRPINNMLGGLKLPNGNSVSISTHFVNRVSNRKIDFDMVKDAIYNPLFTFPPKQDKQGFNMKIIGRDATIVVNPDTGKLITVWKTGIKDLKKYGK